MIGYDALIEAVAISEAEAGVRVACQRPGVARAAESPVMKITLEDVYREVRDMREEVSGVPRTVQDHETRIRALERLVWIASAIAAVGGGALGQVSEKLFGGGS